MRAHGPPDAQSPGKVPKGMGDAGTAATRLPCPRAPVLGALKRRKSHCPGIGMPSTTTAAGAAVHSPQTGLRRSHPATVHWMSLQARTTGKKGVWSGAWRERTPILDGVWSFSLQAQCCFLDPTCPQHYQDFQLPWEGHCTSVSHSLSIDSKTRIEEFSKQEFMGLIASSSLVHVLCILT